MQRLSILHRTYYNFHHPVQLGSHRLLLRPREGPELRIERSKLDIYPPATLRWVRDDYDNAAAIANFTDTTQRLEITSEIVVQHYDDTPLDFLVADFAINYPFVYETEAALVLQPYLTTQAQLDNSLLQHWVENFWQPGQPVQTYVLLERLCRGIKERLTYQAREQPGVQPASETLSRGSGSCRDFANLLMESARHLGLASRFVSGYLNAPTNDGSSGTTHAWTEIYLPGAGWKGFDPTIGEMVSNKHIAVAVSRRPETISPVTGTFFGPLGADLSVGVWVSQL